MKTLGIAIALAAGVLGGACGSDSSPTGDVTATIGGVSWRTPGKGFTITSTDAPTNFILQGATPMPNSPLLDPSKPQLVVVFAQVPSVGTYNTDGTTVTVEYQVDTNTVYSGSNGSVQIASISSSRAQGTFNFDLYSPLANPTMLTVTDGAFDVPVSAH
jgi:hypothetical protein